MMQRSVCYLLCASLLIDSLANSAQPKAAIALQVSEMKEPRQRTLRSVRRRNYKPIYQNTSPVEEIAEHSRALIALSEFNKSTDIDQFIHSPLGDDILSPMVTSLTHEKGQGDNAVAEVLESPKFLWEGDNKVMNFREEKQHFFEQKSTPLPPHGNNKGFKEKSSNSLSTVVIISPAILPSQEEYEADEWNFRDPRITSQHQVIRLNVNKDIHDLVAVLSSNQPREVRSHHSRARPKQRRAISQRPEENFKLGARYNMHYTQYPTPLPPYSKDDDCNEYPQDSEETNEQEHGLSDYDDDDDDDDISFKCSDFSAANLGIIAAHKYNQVKFIWDLFHHGWPLWLEK